MAEVAKKLKNIAFLGAGGIGSHLVGLFFDFGVNRNQFPFTDYKIDVYDDDTVDTKNLLHQNFRDEDLNEMKTEVLSKRYAVDAVNRFMTKADFPKYDLIFCGADSMVIRKELYEWSWENPTKAFWIDGRCESRQGCVFNKSVSRTKLEKFLTDSQTRTGCLLQAEKDADMSHTTPITVASMMMQTFLNYVRGVESLPEKIFMV